MNRVTSRQRKPLTSRQRKLIYLVAIVILLIPIIGWLGMPATGSGGANGKEDGSGGRLARLRKTYQLGESTLGDVDPSSATMNLVLLGLRGVAADLLWMKAIDYKEQKDWAKLRSTVDSIVLLQPHFVQVWQFQGWNLAYNVSAEWDSVKDRYYWVKEGGKFIRKGSERNEQTPELYWYNGDILGKKIGRSDEWKQFRKFFVVDPNTKRFHGRTDPEFNELELPDNYLAAREKFKTANDRENKHVQHVMMRALFRSYPSHSLMEYAHALQRDGLFEEKSRIAWDEAFREWTEVYGKERFHSPAGWIHLEATPADIDEFVRQNSDELKQVAPDATDKQKHDFMRLWVDRYQSTANYRYWRTRALTESDPITMAAHKQIYDGQELFKQQKISPGPGGEPSESEQNLYAGLQKYAIVLSKHPSLISDDDTIEEVMTAMLYLRYLHQLNQTKNPRPLPKILVALWEHEKARLPTLQQRFRRENAIQ